MAAGQSGPCVRQGDLVSPVAEFLFGRKDRYGGNKLLTVGTQTFTADNRLVGARCSTSRRLQHVNADER